MPTLFIGLGRMGAPMVRNYAQVHTTVVYDVGPSAPELAAELGIENLASLGDVPSGVDTVILMLPNSSIVESVLEGDGGVLAQLASGALIIDMGSSVPASTQHLAAKAQQLSIGYVDAPVSGGVAKAVTGELAVMVGGSPSDADRARPHLAPLASAVTYVGPPGSGHVAKALNNLVSATNIAAAAEALSVATAFGIEPRVMIDVLNSATGRSQASEVKFPGFILTGTYTSGFAFDLMVKDMRIALDLGADRGEWMPVTSATFHVATKALIELTRTPTDHTELARYYEVINSVDFSPEHDERVAK